MEPGYKKYKKIVGEDPQIEWIRNWLRQRSDILQKNAESTSWSYVKYYPRKDSEDVRDSGWSYVPYENVWNPLTYFKSSNPVTNQINKLVYSQVENAYNTPEAQVGYGSSKDYNLRGAYVEPNMWNNSGNYIIYAGNPDDDVRIHELTHASHPDQQERYIRDIIFNGNVPNVVKKSGSSFNENTRNAKEIYGALQQFRYKNKLKPKQKIDKTYLNNNRKLFDGSYLNKLSDDVLLRLFNEVAQNQPLRTPNINYYA